MQLPMQFRRYILLIVGLAFTSCGEPSPSGLTVDPNRLAATYSQSGNTEVDEILAESLFLLPATATAELQAKALVSYIGGAFRHGRTSSPDLGVILNEKTISPYTATMLAYHAAGALAWERRVLVLDCVPKTVWYLEVNTEDGRFLLDPYRRSVAALAAPLDPQLAYSDAFTDGAWSQAQGTWPPATFADFVSSWRSSDEQLLHAERYQNACVKAFFDEQKTVAFPIVVNMSGRTLQKFGDADGSPWDLDSLFAGGEHETRSDHAFWGAFESPIGPVTFSHLLHLEGLVPGSHYRYVFQEVGQSQGYSVVLPQGISVGNWSTESGGRRVLPFEALESTATLEVGHGGGSLAIDWFAVAGEQEPLP